MLKKTENRISLIIQKNVITLYAILFYGERSRDEEAREGTPPRGAVVTTVSVANVSNVSNSSTLVVVVVVVVVVLVGAVLLLCVVVVVLVLLFLCDVARVVVVVVSSTITCVKFDKETKCQ
jgi:hypothetical protein